MNTTSTCCSFAQAATREGWPGTSVRLYRLDDGRLICNRCIRAALGWAEAELEQKRRRRDGGWRG
jgi:hypothetical protein